MFLSANVHFELSAFLHTAFKLNPHIQVQHVNIASSFHHCCVLWLWHLHPLPFRKLLHWIWCYQHDCAPLQRPLVIPIVPCVVCLWSAEPAAHQEHHVSLGAIIWQSKVWCWRPSPNYRLPHRPPRMALLRAEELPTDPRAGGALRLAALCLRICHRPVLSGWTDLD